MVRSELGQIKGEEAKTLLSTVPSLMKSVAKKCETEGWSAKVKACVLGAKTQADVDRCERLSLEK